MNKELAERCLRYLDDDLASSELQAFSQMLAESPEAADLLSQLAMDEQHFRVTPIESEDDILPFLLNMQTDPAERAQSYHGTLAVITDPSFWGYVLGSALQSKPGKWVASAAVVMLAASLFFVFSSANDGASAPPDGQSLGNAPQAKTEIASPFADVATFTAEYNAQWQADSGTLLPKVGDGLRPGTRLTLTAGFAEITTVRGAVVILQAPAIIELTDNDNAIRLHTGRLVGLCKTESSKGFTVHTHNARIVDIGTEFGVTLQDRGPVEVHVLTGEVVVRPQTRRSDGDSVVLRERQALRVSSDAGRVDRIAADTEAFVRDIDPVAERERRYVASVMARNPVIYYRFDALDDQGRVRNEMGDRYPGRIVDTVRFESAGLGPLGQAARFIGSGHIQIDQIIRELAGAEQYTFECWVRPDQVHSGSILMLDHITPNGGHATVAGLLVQPPAGQANQEFPGSVRFVHRNPPEREGGVKVHTPSDFYAPGQWMHLVAVKDGAAMTLYIDGRVVAQGNDPTAMTDLTFATLIGRNSRNTEPGSVRHFRGLIDELAIYDRALTAQDATEHYQRAAGALAPGEGG